MGTTPAAFCWPCQRISNRTARAVRRPGAATEAYASVLTQPLGSRGVFQRKQPRWQPGGARAAEEPLASPEGGEGGDQASAAAERDGSDNNGRNEEEEEEEEEDEEEKDEGEEAVQCSIGMCPVTGEEDAASLDKCTHAFHFACIFKWDETTNQCPMCKVKRHKSTRRRPQVCFAARTYVCMYAARRC